MSSSIKKLALGIAILLACLFVANFSFANQEMQKATNAVRDTVQNAENVIENTGKGASNIVKEGTNMTRDGAQNVVNGMGAGLNTMTDHSGNGANYSATRTSTGNGSTAGMNNNVWVWLIVATLALGIIGAIWYFDK